MPERAGVEGQHVTRSPLFTSHKETQTVLLAVFHAETPSRGERFSELRALITPRHRFSRVHPLPPFVSLFPFLPFSTLAKVEEAFRIILIMIGCHVVCSNVNI